MKIGQALFKPTATHKHITPQITSLITNDNFWAIDHKRYQKLYWNCIFSQIQQIYVTTIILDYNSHKTIIKQISHITFTNLKQLWLRQNKITNIEDLANLQAPFLQLLRISMNYIVKFKPLIKIQSRSINEMYIPANPITDFSSVVRTRFNSEMKDIFLEYWSHNNIIAEDLSFIVKLNVRSFHDLWIKGDDRIVQPSLCKNIRNRYSKLNLYLKENDNQDD